MHGRVKCTNPESEYGVGYQHQPQINFERPRCSPWANEKIKSKVSLPIERTQNLVVGNCALVDVTIPSL